MKFMALGLVLVTVLAFITGLVWTIDDWGGGAHYGAGYLVGVPLGYLAAWLLAWTVRAEDKKRLNKVKEKLRKEAEPDSYNSYDAGWADASAEALRIIEANFK